jgi:hypothetical protein
MKRSEVFKSRYLVAADLGGNPVVLEITSAPYETFKAKDGGDGQSKTVLHFRGTAKTLPLNKTNWDAVADATGEDDTVKWPGHHIEAFPTTTEMGGKVVDCIRIRQPLELPLTPGTQQPSQPKLPKSLVGDLDDPVPFQ